MKIRMKGDITGTRNGEQWPRPGGELDVPDDEGATLCASGMAEPVKDDKTETAKLDDTSEKRGRARKSSN